MELILASAVGRSSYGLWVIDTPGSHDGNLFGSGLESVLQCDDHQYPYITGGWVRAYCHTPLQTGD